jgi:hypothetical protein
MVEAGCLARQQALAADSPSLTAWLDSPTAAILLSLDLGANLPVSSDSC